VPYIYITPLNVISIPYGAIKRLDDPVNAVDALSFQFLMVRLKVLLLTPLMAVMIISIPYGAIKSNV